MFCFFNRSPTVALAICLSPARAALDSLKHALLNHAPTSPPPPLPPSPLFNRFAFVKKPGRHFGKKNKKLQNNLEDYLSHFTRHPFTLAEIEKVGKKSQKIEFRPTLIKTRHNLGKKQVRSWSHSPKPPFASSLAKDNLSAIFNAKHD